MEGISRGVLLLEDGVTHLKVIPAKRIEWFSSQNLGTPLSKPFSIRQAKPSPHGTSCSLTSWLIHLHSGPACKFSEMSYSNCSFYNTKLPNLNRICLLLTKNTTRRQSSIVRCRCCFANRYLDVFLRIYCISEVPTNTLWRNIPTCLARKLAWMALLLRIHTDIALFLQQPLTLEFQGLHLFLWLTWHFASNWCIWTRMHLMYVSVRSSPFHSVYRR